MPCRGKGLGGNWNATGSPQTNSQCCASQYPSGKPVHSRHRSKQQVRSGVRKVHPNMTRSCIPCVDRTVFTCRQIRYEWRAQRTNISISLSLPQHSQRHAWFGIVRPKDQPRSSFSPNNWRMAATILINVINYVTGIMIHLWQIWFPPASHWRQNPPILGTWAEVLGAHCHGFSCIRRLICACLGRGRAASSDFSTAAVQYGEGNNRTRSSYVSTSTAVTTEARYGDGHGVITLRDCMFGGNFFL